MASIARTLLNIIYTPTPPSLMWLQNDFQHRDSDFDSQLTGIGSKGFLIIIFDPLYLLYFVQV